MRSSKLRAFATVWLPVISAIAAAIWTVVTYFVPGHANDKPSVAVSPAASPAATSSASRSSDPVAPASSVSATNGVAIGGNVDNSTITVNDEPPKD